MVVFENVTKGGIKVLVEAGYSKEPPKSIYEEARLTKDGVTLIHYTSGKLLVQGKPTLKNKIAAELKKLKIGQEMGREKFLAESGWVIGSDESLKGDTFGGIVVAAVKADDVLREQLIAIGVDDSKKLGDKEIIFLAEKIKKIAPCEIKSLSPEEYNAHKGTVTELLDKLHGECAKYLAPGKHVVDKYPGCKVGSIITEKAESKYAEVAAASILARDAALKQMNVLSQQAGFELPKGSSHVEEGLKELKKRGLDFGKFVKINFGNVKEFLDRK